VVFLESEDRKEKEPSALYKTRYIDGEGFPECEEVRVMGERKSCRYWIERLRGILISLILYSGGSSKGKKGSLWVARP